MALEPTQRIAVNGGVPADLSLTPEEYFVLSRVDRPMTVEELLVATGLGRDKTAQIVQRLLDLEAIVRVAEPPASASSVNGALRDRARGRRRNVLQAQLASQVASGQSQPPVRAESSTTPAVVTPDTKASPWRNPWPQVELDDPRLDPELEIPIEAQRTSLALMDLGAAIDPFVILGLLPTRDRKLHRRAFHEASRKLHPDAYYGREIGDFRKLLSKLFLRAKEALTRLQNDGECETLVHRYEQQQRVEEEKKIEAAAAESQAQAQLRATNDEAERAAAEHQRVQRTARIEEHHQRWRGRVTEALRGEVERHLAAAEQAKSRGDLRAAANFSRLASAADPGNAELRQHWEQALEQARQSRAQDAFEDGMALQSLGRVGHAALRFTEAAETSPTAERLAYAADSLRLSSPGRAREFALRALEELGRLPVSDEPQMAARRGAVHLMIGRAFLAAGQTRSAREQALLARKFRPHDPEVRALLNSIKVT